MLREETLLSAVADEISLSEVDLREKGLIDNTEVPWHRMNGKLISPLPLKEVLGFFIG